MAGLLVPLHDVQESPIVAGINQYYQARQLAYEKQRQQMMDQASLAEHGLISNGQGGFQLDPAHQQMQQSQLKNLQNEDTQFKAGLLTKHMSLDPTTGEPTLDSTGQKLENIHEAMEQAQLKELQAHANLFNAAAGLKGSQAATNPQDTKFLDGQLSTLQKDKNFVQAQGTLDQVQQARAVVQDALSNPESKQAAAAAMTRLMSGGAARINAQVLQAMGGSGAVQDKISQAFSGAASGTLTPENGKYMQQLIDQMEASTSHVIDSSYEHAAAVISANTGGRIPVADAFLRLSGKPMTQSQTVSNLTNGGEPGPAAQNLGVPDPHQAALQWANANPNDPRAAQIKQLVGGQNLPSQSAPQPSAPAVPTGLPSQSKGAQGLINGLQSPAGGSYQSPGANNLMQGSLLQAGQDPVTSALIQRSMQQGTGYNGQ